MLSEFLKNNYSYQSAWITHANSAAAIGLTILGLFSVWVLQEHMARLLEYKILGGLFFVSLFASIFYYVKIIYPNLASSSSLIYFGGVTSLSKDEFKNTLKSLTEDQINEEYSNQVYVLATIAKKKFQNFQIALILSVIVMLLSIIVSTLEIPQMSCPAETTFILIL